MRSRTSLEFYLQGLSVMERWELNHPIGRSPSKDAKELLFFIDRICAFEPDMFEKEIKNRFYCNRLELSWVLRDFLIDSDWDEEAAEAERRRFEKSLRKIGPASFYDAVMAVHVDPWNEKEKASWEDWVKFARSVDMAEAEKEKAMAALGGRS